MTSKTTDLTPSTNEMAPVSLAGLASLAMDPSTMNGMVMRMYSSKTMGVDLDLKELVIALNDQIDWMRRGDKTHFESILFSQAVTLNTIFLEMARRVALNIGQHLDATEAYSRMALKAQNQVRMTLETLNNIKNPPVVIAKQANISTGHQQVNNVQVDARSQPIQNWPNQETGSDDVLHQDARTPCGAGGQNKALEALGEVNWPQDARG